MLYALAALMSVLSVAPAHAADGPMLALTVHDVGGARVGSAPVDAWWSGLQTASLRGSEELAAPLAEVKAEVSAHRARYEALMASDGWYEVRLKDVELPAMAPDLAMLAPSPAEVLAGTTAFDLLRTEEPLRVSEGGEEAWSSKRQVSHAKVLLREDGSVEAIATWSERVVVGRGTWHERQERLISFDDRGRVESVYAKLREGSRTAEVVASPVREGAAVLGLDVLQWMEMPDFEKGSGMQRSAFRTRIAAT